MIDMYDVRKKEGGSQGYLALKKMPTPQGPPLGPYRRPRVES